MEQQEDALCLAGVGDLKAGELLFDRPLDGVPEGRPRILLTHNPDAADRLSPQTRIDLLIAGHTHGGQICPPGLGPLGAITRYRGRYLGGLMAAPGFPVLVSRGIGMVALPMRLGVRPRLCHITLTRAV